MQVVGAAHTPSAYRTSDTRAFYTHAQEYFLLCITRYTLVIRQYQRSTVLTLLYHSDPVQYAYNSGTIVKNVRTCAEPRNFLRM